MLSIVVALIFWAVIGFAAYEGYQFYKWAVEWHSVGGPICRQERCG
jgi:hypothetical protein